MSRSSDWEEENNSKKSHCMLNLCDLMNTMIMGSTTEERTSR